MIPMRTYILYATGGFAMHASNFLLSTWLIKFYTPGPGKHLVDPIFFGYILLFGRLIDAVTDPLVGAWSDHHKGPRGRRVPFLLWGGPLLALSLWWSFTPPVASLSIWNGLYLIALMAAFFVFYTIVVTPYLAILPELSSDAKVRVNLTTWQAGFVLVATIYVAALSGPMIQGLGYGTTMAISAALILLTSWLPILVAPKQDTVESAHTEKASLPVMWARSWGTLQDKAFRHILFSTSAFWFSLNLLMASIALWVVNVLKGKEADVAQIMMPFIVANLLGFFIFNRLAHRIGKYKVFIIMFVMMAFVSPFWYFIERQSGSMPYSHAMILCFGLGFPLAAFQVVPFALLADVIDQDEKKHGARREAIFFGMQAIFQKTSIGLSIVIMQYMRTNLGEVKALRLLGPLAGIFCVIGLFAWLGYPLREAPQDNDESNAQANAA
ncbi:MAG: MFS transporter [Myxococcales bacterium]|nr:MFS transporter [Myxococcales bacterium]